MGLFDLFKPRTDPLLEWMKSAYALREDGGRWAGRAHGRALTLNQYDGRQSTMVLWLVGEHPAAPAEQPFNRFDFVRPETYLKPGEENALPAITDADWRARIEEANGMRLGGGFLLDPDFDPDAPFIHVHGKTLAGYLERFTPAAKALIAELPSMRLDMAHAQASPESLRRDVECAHELLRFFEDRRFDERRRDLWQHSSRL